MFQEIGELQGGLVPDPDKEISIDSFVEQYKERAKEACQEKGWSEDVWRTLAEIWAQTDMDIFRDVAYSINGSVRDAIIKLAKKSNIKTVRPVEKAQTYDLEVAHPDHQYYLSNGMLTSNSHATLYSMISFHTAYLKANYPIEFLVANLMSEVRSNAKAARDNITKIKNEIRARRVKIVPPDVNKSGLSWKIVDDRTLMTGLDSLKFMGKDAIPELIEKRPFSDYQDLIYRTHSQKVRSPSIQAMAASGSLDSFGMDRKIMYHYASDYRAKLRSHMARLDRAWAKKWAEENDYVKDSDELGDFWRDKFGTRYEPPPPPDDRKTAHLAEFHYPFPDETPWTVQERFALEEYYMGEGISGDTFERYPDFFDRKKSVPFAALPEAFPWSLQHEDERTNRKANTHYLANHKMRPMEAVIVGMFVFVVKNEESPIFGKEMARFTIQDPWGDESTLLAFPEGWEEMKNRIGKELSNGQKIEPGLAIRFIGQFQWETEHTTSFVLGDILDFKAPPSLPEDYRCSKMVKMPRTKKVKAEEISSSTMSDVLEQLEDEMLDNGLSSVDDEDDEVDSYDFS